MKSPARISAAWALAGVFTLAIATPGSAFAEPDAPAGVPSVAVTSPAALVPAAKSVMQVLHEKGLLPPAEALAPAPAASRPEAQPLVQQVRDKASDLVLSAMNFLGVRYRRGGQSEQGFDCSGFTRYVFEHSLGRVLPRRADQQAREAGLLDVKKDELRPGDLVFFNTMRRAFSHVGIYIGEGKFIHSPRAGGEVRIEDMGQAYWVQRFNGARRADLPQPQVSAPPQ